MRCRRQTEVSIKEEWIVGRYQGEEGIGTQVSRVPGGEKLSEFLLYSNGIVCAYLYTCGRVGVLGWIRDGFDTSSLYGPNGTEVSLTSEPGPASGRVTGKVRFTLFLLYSSNVPLRGQRPIDTQNQLDG